MVKYTVYDRSIITYDMPFFYMMLQICVLIFCHIYEHVCIAHHSFQLRAMMTIK